jgi:hypothetical protein
VHVNLLHLFNALPNWTDTKKNQQEFVVFFGVLGFTLAIFGLALQGGVIIYIFTKKLTSVQNKVTLFML